MNFIQNFDFCESYIDMADGLNQARAMRTTEVIEEFRELQHQIAQFTATPSNEERNGEGYKLLRQCTSESKQILKAPFAATSDPPHGDLEKEAEQLRQVMLDAASRRFLAQRVYLRAMAAMKWINSRTAVLNGGSPTPTNAAALQVVNSTLRTELASITDFKIVADLLANDQQQGKWTEEDPDLTQIQRFVDSQRSRGS